MLFIKQNTYPKHVNIEFGQVNDIVHWELVRGYYHLCLENNKAIFMSPGVNKDGILYSTGRPFSLIGVIAQVKSKGWILELETLDINEKCFKEKEYPDYLISGNSCNDCKHIGKFNVHLESTNYGKGRYCEKGYWKDEL